jgi:site-specific recombinase
MSIALVNLVVSFSLALYVAMQSRGMGAKPVFALGLLVVKRFAREPLAFFSPPPR